VTQSEDRRLAVELFNGTWRLMESREDDERMLHAAHASAYHWGEAPECEPKNQVRSEWQVSRVYSVLGRGEPAVWHAARCLAICEAHPDNMEDWDLPFAYEALARAHGVSGAAEEARRYEQQARELADRVAAPEDREHLIDALSDLAR
jgi:hypothetical protein